MLCRSLVQKSVERIGQCRTLFVSVKVWWKRAVQRDGRNGVISVHQCAALSVLKWMHTLVVVRKKGLEASIG